MAELAKWTDYAYFLFNSKCARHMPAKGSIHCHDYNEDVFPCVQFFRTYDRFDAPTFVEYLKAMQKHFGKVAAVVDRASPHRAKLVRKLLRENKNIRIIYLPKGSSYLNAVEECWRRGKQVLLVSEYYKTFVDMCSAISTHYRTARFTLDILKFANRKAALFCTNL